MVTLAAVAGWLAGEVLVVSAWARLKVPSPRSNRASIVLPRDGPKTRDKDDEAIS